MNVPMLESQPLVCDLTAIPTPVRQEHLLTATQVFQAAVTIQDLPNGYALRLPNEGDLFMALARFVENERRCCPFFHFGLDLEPNGGPLWLRITGGEGVKELLQSVLSDNVDPDKLKELIHTGGDAQLDDRVAQAWPQLAEAFKKVSPA